METDLLSTFHQITLLGERMHSKCRTYYVLVSLLDHLKIRGLRMDFQMAAFSKGCPYIINVFKNLIWHLENWKKKFQLYQLKSLFYSRYIYWTYDKFSMKHLLKDYSKVILSLVLTSRNDFKPEIFIGFRDKNSL